MFEEFSIQEIFLDSPQEIAEVKRFLKEFKLEYHPEYISYTLKVMDQSQKMVATGSLDKNIIKCLAILPEYQESNLFAKIISHLLDYLAQNDIYNSFVFTKCSTAKSFENLGFTRLSEICPTVALLEYGNGIQEYKNYLLENKFSQKESQNGIIIVNCNPFTLGHRYLIESAAKECDFVYVIVVEEDRSSFPFTVRYRLVQEGLQDLKNVKVLKGGHYVISSITFPRYFLKNTTELELTALQAEFDIRIFASQYFV